MKSKYFSILGAAALVTAVSPFVLVPTTVHALSTEVAPKDEDVQILTRGPVHEAFAAVVSARPEPGFIVTKAPPGVIEELPPEHQLEGDNVTWISGYWAWDDDTSDFLWISGVWRNIPPGRQWVPGYWNDLGDGRWQWTSGYWADTSVTEVDYVDEAPPENLDSGPNVAPPDDDSTWIPGNWRYVETRYVWSPGYYTPLRPDWTWVPSCWNWTPRGYCYNDGYWDYGIANRGVLFAPAYFHRPLWTDPYYYYTPSVVVSLGVFDNHCWIRPRFGHYYYGDYYGSHYSDLGFFVSHHWHGHHGHYDPIWAHNHWHHRHDGAWASGVRDRYAFFRDNADARPLRTWAAMRDFRSDRFSDDQRSRSRLFASSLDGFVNNPVRGERFRRISREGRDQLVAQRQQVRDFAQQRRQLETARVARPDTTDAAARTDRLALQRERFSRSPVAGRQIDQIASNQAPPQRPRAARDATRVRPEAVVRPDNNVGRNRDALASRNSGAGAARLGPQINRNPDANANRSRVGPQAQTNPRDAVRDGAGSATPRRTPQVAPQQRQTPRQSVQPSPQRNRQQATPTPQQRQAQPRQSVQPQRRPQVTPQSRPQARPTPQQRVAPQRQNVQPQRSRQQASQPQRQIQRQQAARPSPQRSVPQVRQQARPQVRQSVQRPQVQRSRPSIQQSRPQVRQASAPRSSQQRSTQARSTQTRSSSSQQRQSGRSRN